MELEGRVTISRQVSGGEDDRITITIRDERAGIEFCTAELSLEDFGRAITGVGFLPCKLMLRGIERLGLVREHKTMDVDLAGARSDVGIRVAIAQHETDGWRGNDRDAKNHHRRSKSAEDHYSVGFERWVKP